MMRMRSPVYKCASGVKVTRERERVETRRQAISVVLERGEKGERVS